MPTHEVLRITLVTSRMISISGPYIKMDNICYTLGYSIGATGSGTGPASTRPSSLCSSSDGPSTRLDSNLHPAANVPTLPTSGRQNFLSGTLRHPTSSPSLESRGLFQPLLSTSLHHAIPRAYLPSLPDSGDQTYLTRASEAGVETPACVHASVSSQRYYGTNPVSLEHCGAHQPLLNTATMSSRCRPTGMQPPAHFAGGFAGPTIHTTTCNNWVTPGPSMGNNSASPSVYGSLPLYYTGRSKSGYENIRTMLKARIKEDSGLDILCLSSDDLTAFTNSAGQAGLVPRQVMEDLTVMHPSVSYESRCRYLVLHINKEIRCSDGDMLNRFIDLIFKFFDIDQIKQYAFKYSHVLLKPAHVLLKPVQVLTCNTNLELRLDSHLGRLCEVLSDYSYLWDKIGIALHFNADDLKRIEMESRDASRCLHSLLHTWLSRKYKYVKLPTFKHLQGALCSKLVGLGRIANGLEGIFQTTETSMMSCDRSYSCKTDRNITMYTSPGIAVKESEYAITYLLEVIVRPHRHDSLSFEWYINGMCVDSGNSILCITLQDIVFEGEYECVCGIGGRKITSDIIVIHVETLLCKYKTQLSARYKSQPEVHVEEHAWPDVQQDTYINLAVIGGKGKMSYKCYQQTIRGDADDVLSGSKANIEYRQAFQDINHGDRVLVVGRPGSGKTTLVHRVSQDWARGLMLRIVKALFLIYLRGFHSNLGVSLKSLVKCYFKNEVDVEAVCQYIEEHQGLGVCFILDGLDEYQPEMDEDAPNFIFQLIRGDVLPCAVVIVASRPAAIAMFTKVARRHVEVLGFFKQQVEEYINSYEFNSHLKQSALKKYLEHHPNVHHMCYLPIQTAMICFLFDVCEETLPNTETGIYKEFTKQTVLRALYRRIASRHKAILSLEHLDKKEKDIVFQICKLAFEMTRSYKQVIQQEADTIDESLGLITVDWKATICGFQNMYSFCHLTFQEFLAAYHISRLEVQEQLAIIQSCGPMKHMYMVFKFYCGLVKFEEDCGRFKELLEVAEFETLHKLHCCFESQQPATCDFVADNGMIVVDDSFRTPSDYTCLGYVVVNAKKNTVRMMEFDGRASLKEECVEAFIKATNGTRRAASPVELLTFKDSKCLEHHLELVRACPSLLVVQWHDPEYLVIDCRSVVSYPSLEIVRITGWSDIFILITSRFKKVMKDFKQIFPNVRNIGVWGDIASGMQKCSNPPLCPFHSVYCKPISSFSNGDLHRAKVLTISYDMRSTHECHHIGNEYHCECLCTHLYIFNCNINNTTAALLTEGLKYNIGLNVLKLVANSIGDEGAVAIADSIKCCSSLHWLDLSLNRIGDEGAAALVSSLDSRSNFKLHLFGNCISDSIIARVCSMNNRELLQTLDICTNCIGDVGLACIDSLMKEWTPPLSTVKTLHTLYLQSCNNSPDGIKSVAKILSRFTSLQSVSLIDMNICDEGVRLLSDSLQWCCISVLILSQNKIGDDGARAIAHALRGCEVLSVLDLSGNGIQDAGTEALSEALSSCKLQRLTLASNCIGDDGARAIANALRGCEVLSVLDLSGNGIQDAGTEALSEALRCCKLQRLSLASNCMGPSGALAVAGVLKHVCISLDTLDLSCNRLGDVGVVCLAGGLKHCSCLKQLHLNCNFVGDDGAMALARCLQTCNQLTTLNLGDNEIGDSGALCLGNCLKDCSCLHTLRLNHNLISGGGAVGVAEGVKHCRCLHTLEIGWNFIFLKDINTIICTLKNCANLRRLFVAKHDYIKDDVFMNTEFLPFNYLPQCDVIMELRLKDDGTYGEINYNTYKHTKYMKFVKLHRVLKQVRM